MPKYSLPGSSYIQDGEVPQKLKVAFVADEEERLVTYKEVAAEFNVAPLTIAAWGTHRVIPSYLVGKRSRRYKLSEIRKYIESCKVTVCSPTPAEKETSNAS